MPVGFGLRIDKFFVAVAGQQVAIQGFVVGSNAVFGNIVKVLQVIVVGLLVKRFMEFVINSVDVDVMAGFSILNDGKIYDCSLDKDQIVEWFTLGNTKIPLQSPLLWCEYYKLMGRKEKVDMIERVLSKS